MKLIDEAIIQVQAGKGGAGLSHFRREALVQYGGPDGGNGGHGGSVIIRATRNKRTLLDFAFEPIWKAQDGERGGTSSCSGKAGEDRIIEVPIGTQVFKLEHESLSIQTAKDSEKELIVDLVEDASELTLANGGRGGKGNEFFKSATRRAPEHAQPGESGDAGYFMLSLKLMADVGLLGFPNAGKSTLISRISAAKPKIADYPFTTLEPNLGVVKAKGNFTFVVADIPGLIPGASSGKGLGIQFLKHVERTSILAHLIDVNGVDENGEPQDIFEAFSAINEELASYDEMMSKKKQVVVLTKIDAVSKDERAPITKIQKKFEKMGYKCFVISSVSGEGLEVLVEELASSIKE